MLLGISERDQAPIIPSESQQRWAAQGNEMPCLAFVEEEQASLLSDRTHGSGKINITPKNLSKVNNNRHAFNANSGIWKTNSRHADLLEKEDKVGGSVNPPPLPRGQSGGICRFPPQSQQCPAAKCCSRLFARGVWASMHFLARSLSGDARISATFSSASPLAFQGGSQNFEGINLFAFGISLFAYKRQVMKESEGSPKASVTKAVRQLVQRACNCS